MSIKKIKIGLIGNERYENKRRIKDFIFKLKKELNNNFIIASRGNVIGAERYIKKYTLEMDCDYLEFNPSHTVKNLYSALNESFYNKEYKPKNYYIINNIMSKSIDSLVIFSENNMQEKGISNMIKNTKKLNKNIIIIN